VKIKVFVNSKVSTELEYFATSMGVVEIIQCPMLIEPFVTARFYCYQKELSVEESNDKIAMVDSGDVVFLDDVFKKIIRNGVYLVREPSHFPMSKCPHHKRWIAHCPKYGQHTWDMIKNNDMLCAGTIFGTADYLAKLFVLFVNELKETNCNDQGLLNILTYTGQVEKVVPGHLVKWAYRDNIVLSMNVSRTFDHHGASVVHTGDNPKAVKAMKRRKMNLFRDVLTYQESLNAIGILETIDKMFTRSDIDYVIDGGTLIGAVLHGGRIPWDDDMDIYIKASALDRLQEVIVSNYSHLSLTPSYNGFYYKLWDKTNTRRRGSAYSWPFVDVGLLEENSTHVWERRIAEKKYSHHIYSKAWVFPSKRIKYETIYLNGPKDPQAFLNSRFSKNWNKNCVYANWDHKLERIRNKYLGDGNVKVIVPCENIKWLKIAFENETSKEKFMGYGGD